MTIRPTQFSTVSLLAVLLVSCIAALPAHGQEPTNDVADLLNRLRPSAADGWNQPSRQNKMQALRVVRQTGLGPVARALRTAADPSTRQAAALVLGHVGDQEGVDTDEALALLIETLRTPDEVSRVQAQAALSMGYVGDSRGVAPLTRVLEDAASPDVRVAAARGLGLIGGEAARTSLLDARNDPLARVRQAIAEALAIV